MESEHTSMISVSRASICSRDIPSTSPESVTPHSNTPPFALAKAVISSAQLSRLGSIGRLPLNTTCLNSQ